ncbi:tyrosine-protein kinase ITK/TSK-like isoform X1 [Salvelinus fontinalis]|uniref:tyrosine-protein kinase ITK/TSK-like isoform X1 n=1 Tax=Salvelinus fontinalis TaxID=8038 RepID=UPI002486B666|nr:tyrosine-protein kinase ITK/TSK-like isoform X1 [Salvelinus fontinalis]
MLPTVILKGTLIKKSQQKRRTSPCNYKERLFVLDTQDLTYSEQRPGKKPSQKGCIELSRIKCVEIVCSEVPIPCSNKYPFQVVHDNCYLYIFAPDNDCRQRWVRALKEETKCNALLLKYHPNFWMEGRWRCCYQTEKMATGCQEYDPVGFGTASKKPLPPTPDTQRRISDPDQSVVVALQNYSPHGDTELPLHKDQEYILTDSSHHDWWTVQDHRGNTGFVPCTYIAEKSYNNFNRFEWYNKDITRGRAEELLMTEGKEGAFMVRDSRHAGVYTVSVFTKAPGSNGQKNPRVKHYQIRQSEAEETSKFYLAEKYLFMTIPELIQYHQHNAAGLITRLRHPISQGRESFQSPAELSKGQWEVDPADLILGEEVGSGQFGLVLQGRWRERRVAVKMVREGAMSEEDFKEEARVMTMLSHCKLVQLYGVCTQHSPMCLVFELMEQGCLSDYLRARRGRMSQDTLLGMCLDISEGMAYLESNNFIHRDLAARNCLVSCNNVVKVSDFGMTRFVLDDQYTSSQGSKFPIKWSSPEVIKYCKFSSKSDIWSFGVCMWEVYTEGRLPYENRSNGEVVEALNAGLRLLKPRQAPEAVHLLMEWCWKEKPEDRPSFALLLHELASLSDL